MGMEMYCVDANVACNEKFLNSIFSLFFYTYFPSEVGDGLPERFGKGLEDHIHLEVEVH